MNRLRFSFNRGRAIPLFAAAGALASVLRLTFSSPSHGSFDFSFAGCETIFQIVEELSNVFERDLLPTLNSLSRTRSAGSSSEKLPPQRLTGTL